MERSSFVSNVSSIIEKSYPNITIDDGKLVFGDLKINIDDLFSVYEASSSKIDPNVVIQEFLESVSTTFISPNQINLNNILPRIYEKKFVDDNGIDSGIRYVNNTVIVPVVNFKFFFLPITKKMLAQSNVHDEDLLMRIMRSNLAEKLDFDMKIVKQEGGYKTIILTNPDGFASSFILIDGIYTQISEELGLTYYVGIPDRDIFMASNKEASGKLKYNTKKFYEKSANKISKNVFTVTMDGVAGSVMREKE